jgi:MFS family permease
LILPPDEVFPGVTVRSRFLSLVPQSWRDSPTLAPFHSRVFAMIWTASLVSNFGSLIQAVGASWMMTSIAPSADMVALVQASTTLPIMLLSLASGATADIWDRRLVMLIAQVVMLIVALALTLIAFLGQITPWTLLTLTFLLGCGVALYGPAWQSSVGEQVKRPDLPSAVALNSLSFNIARTAGPAIGGIIVAKAGPPAAFLINALSYVALITVLVLWRRPRPAPFLPPENKLMAMGAGIRYAR